MKTILVPLDGSSLAEQVLPQVQLLALRMDASICLLRVVSDIEHVSMVGDTILGFHDIDEPPERYQERERRVWQIERQRAENYLAARATQLRAIGLNVTFSALLGPPPEIILETARRCHANLIAMATHGASGLRRWALGSVADKVVQAATTPVLLIRGAAKPQRSPALDRILVPLDGSTLSEQALPIAADLALHASADLMLLRVVAPPTELHPGFRPLGQTPPTYDDIVVQPRQQASQALVAIATNLGREHISSTTAVVAGHAAEAIVDEAARRGADLIVMATHGYGGLRRWAIGSVADKVLHATKTPLILVRAYGSG